MRINRYIMECKYFLRYFGDQDVEIELIDTLWNVNTDDSVAIKANKTGINRYIMECKLGLTTDGMSPAD